MNLDSRANEFAPQIPEPLARRLRIGHAPKQTSWSVRVSSSKSATNRATVLAAMSSTPVEIVGPLLADDTWWGLKALEAFGFVLDVSTLPAKIRISPPTASKAAANCLDLYVGQAGTLARFLPAALINWNQCHPHVPVHTFRMSADEQLIKRPIMPLLEALKSLGGRFSAKTWPLEILPSRIAGQCQIDGSQSGQFLSGLLLAAAGSGQDCTIERVNHLVQPDYVRITIAMLAAFGVTVEHDASLHRFFIASQRLQPPHSFSVEADASTACYFAALACVLGCDLDIVNLGTSTRQPDFTFIERLEQFGFPVETKEHQCSVKALSGDGKPLADSTLAMDLTACSDQALTAGVLALCLGRSVHVSGVAHIRHHESDRIASFCQNCRELGFAVQEFPDGFFVPSGVQVEQLSGVWKTHNDHRFALAGVVLASCAPRVSVENVGCIKKTAPDFIQKLSELGFSFH